MIPELIGAIGVVFAAVITGLFHRMRRDNDAAHGKAIAKLEDIAETVHDIDEQLDGMAEWQEEHPKYHDRAARTPR